MLLGGERVRRFVLLIKKSSVLTLKPQYGILLKGGTLPPGSIRVWGGVKYRKFGPGDWRPLVERKEHWDSSDEKAKELTISMFGTPDEVREMAKPIRLTNGLAETKETLKKIAQKGELTSKSGITASLSGKSVDKIMSGQASQQSFSQKAHWLAAANIDKLFENAIEPWEFELDPGKNNENLKGRKYLYAIMNYERAILPVKITVKEYKQQGIGKRIYSLEAIAVEIK
jgi:hypothetical protein